MKIVYLLLLCFFPSFLFSQVSVFTLENRLYEGKIIGLNNDSNPFITLQTRAETKKIFCHEIVQVVYQKSDKKKVQEVCIILHDGSQIFGNVLSGDQKALVMNSFSFGEISIDLTQIREIRLSDTLASVESKDTESDILYFKTGDVLKCLIVYLGAGYVQVQHPQLGIRKEYFAKLDRIVFAQLESPSIPKGELIAIVRGMDHSLLAGKIVKISENHLTLHVLSLNQEIKILHSQIQHFAFRGGSFVYLSDLPADEYKAEYIPYFAGPTEPFLPKFDKNQRGGEIFLNGQSFFKGIGVISRTEITVSLQKKYRKFQSHIGIDDQIREMYKQNPYLIGGSVSFQVYLDGQKKWDSGIIRWFDPPQSLDINVSGYKDMVLIVDFADNANANDLANWAGALLVK